MCLQNVNAAEKLPAGLGIFTIGFCVSSLHITKPSCHSTTFRNRTQKVTCRQNNQQAPHHATPRTLPTKSPTRYKFTCLHLTRADISVSHSLPLHLPPRRTPLLADPRPNLGLQPHGRCMLELLRRRNITCSVSMVPQNCSVASPLSFSGKGGNN